MAASAPPVLSSRPIFFRSEPEERRQQFTRQGRIQYSGSHEDDFSATSSCRAHSFDVPTAIHSIVEEDDDDSDNEGLYMRPAKRSREERPRKQEDQFSVNQVLLGSASRDIRKKQSREQQERKESECERKPSGSVPRILVNQATRSSLRERQPLRKMRTWRT